MDIFALTRFYRVGFLWLLLGLLGSGFATSGEVAGGFLQAKIGDAPQTSPSKPGTNPGGVAKLGLSAGGPRNPTDGTNPNVNVIRGKDDKVIVKITNVVSPTVTSNSQANAESNSRGNGKPGDRDRDRPGDKEPGKGGDRFRGSDRRDWENKDRRECGGDRRNWDKRRRERCNHRGMDEGHDGNRFNGREMEGTNM